MQLRNKIYQGDCTDIMKTFPEESVNCIVTSPPYWGLRDYGVEGQLGLEKTPQEFVKNMVILFREARRVLKNDGTLWMNMGDSYCGSTTGSYSGKCIGLGGGVNTQKEGSKRPDKFGPGLKPKDLVGIPWMLAFALRDDGWYLRQDIIWHKPNPMPESVIDRCTKSHEYVFLFSKSSKYYYDADAIREPLKESSILRLSEPNLKNQIGSVRAHAGGKTNGNMKAVCKSLPGGQSNIRKKRDADRGKSWHDHKDDIVKDNRIRNKENHPLGANKRSVWTVPTAPYKEAHFATFPSDLIKPCILAGCPRGGVVLDPFMGSGTTAEVSRNLMRYYVGIELNPDYVQLINKRLKQRDIMDEMANMENQ